MLAVLAGKTPSEWSAPAIRLSNLRLPASLPLELPSDLVHQRPDILAAEAELHGASAAVGVATAALYPSLVLNGAYGGNNTAPNAVFTPNAQFWSFGAGLTQPIFEGGTLRYKRRAALDAYDAALAGYRKTVLTAFAQVADALRPRARRRTGRRGRAGVRRRGRSARSDAGRLHGRYRRDLQVLVANAQYLQARTALIAATAQRFQDTVALYAAMGCGAAWPPQQDLTTIGGEDDVQENTGAR